MLSRRKVVSLIECLFILLFIIENYTVYAASDNNYIPEITGVLAAITLALRVPEMKFKRSTFSMMMICFVIYYLLMFAYMIVSVNPVGMYSFISRFLILLPVLVLLFVHEFSAKTPYRLLYKYSDIMTVLAGMSLVFWVFGTNLHILKPTGYVRAFWGVYYNYPTYFGLHFERQATNMFGIQFLRNQGLFCEGPMYSICLVYGLSVELLLRKPSFETLSQACPSRVREEVVSTRKKHRRQIILLSAALVTTLTTTGYILLIAMLLASYTLSKPRSNLARAIKYISYISVVIVMMAGAYYIFKAKESSHSWQGRLADFRAGFAAWKDAPIFGNGFGEFDVLRHYLDRSFRTNVIGFSNSITVVLAEGGIVLMVPYFFGMVGGIVVSLKSRKLFQTAFIAIVLIDWMFTMIVFRVLTLFYLAFFIALVINGSKNDLCTT